MNKQGDELPFIRDKPQPANSRIDQLNQTYQTLEGFDSSQSDSAYFYLDLPTLSAQVSAAQSAIASGSLTEPNSAQPVSRTSPYLQHFLSDADSDEVPLLLHLSTVLAFATCMFIIGVSLCTLTHSARRLSQKAPLSPKAFVAPPIEWRW